MIEPNRSASGNLHDISKLLSKKAMRLLHHKVDALQREGGLGELRIEFHNGDIYKIYYTSESMTKDEPEE